VRKRRERMFRGIEKEEREEKDREICASLGKAAGRVTEKDKGGGEHPLRGRACACTLPRSGAWSIERFSRSPGRRSCRICRRPSDTCQTFPACIATSAATIDVLALTWVNRKPRETRRDIIFSAWKNVRYCRETHGERDGGGENDGGGGGNINNNGMPHLVCI